MALNLLHFHAYGKASRMLGAINRIIKHKDKYILLNLYKSLVRPHLEYSLSAWLSLIHI